jgi:hypothetical protein
MDAAGIPSLPAAQTVDTKVLRAWALGAAALLAALGINYATGTYVDSVGPSLTPARDTLFQFIPFKVFPFIHTWGFVGFLIVLNAAVLVDEPAKRGPFFMWAYALIIATRAVFTTLTPLGLPAEAPTFEHFPIQGFFHSFDFRSTMFFSGHTAFPFMGFLLLRQRWARWASLGFSLMLASSVLLSRLHYSIDVGAAFFIAYAVAHLARRSWRSVGRLAGFRG